MVMVYELWDTESANRLGEYVSEGQALAVVHAALKRVPREEVATWALLYFEEGKDSKAIAEGEALIDLASRAAATDSR
ncbi:MAG: hypothetical protein ACRDJ9_12565 [Dehalococcoidia bacterium]